ncbi:hypothetical protein [Cohnella abietis]|uniref:Uncharacterized protein n=1 Tax=Cohnella abietis TaxID=2507935 RepID=A0A3T1D3G7_9BACL|nr:hypothetical protein [Cohnella abietis]BBI32666.1 hypothetical protein KCTCHS21_20650 [Cohnella abietis]
MFKEFQIDEKSGVVSGEVDIGAVKRVKLYVGATQLSTNSIYNLGSPGEVIIADLFAY